MALGALGIHKKKRVYCLREIDFDGLVYTQESGDFSPPLQIGKLYTNRVWPIHKSGNRARNHVWRSCVYTKKGRGGGVHNTQREKGDCMSPTPIDVAQSRRLMRHRNQCNGRRTRNKFRHPRPIHSFIILHPIEPRQLAILRFDLCVERANAEQIM